MPRRSALAVLTRARLVTAAIAAAGTAAFWLLGLPLPFLFGPMAATLIGALCGARLASVGPLGDAARAVVGVTVGSSVTPALFEALPQFMASLALVPFYILAVGAVGIPYFRRVHGFDPVTAYYAAMPGGMQDMVLFGQEAGANVRALSLIHATRVLILVAAAPAVLALVYDVSLRGAIGAPPGQVSPQEMLLMLFAAVVGVIGGKRIGLFGAAIFGPLILTAAMSLTGLIDSRPPREAILASQFVIGMSIGVFYVGLTLRELRNFVLTGIGFAAIMGTATAIFAEIVSVLGLASPIEAFLAFAPGGQAEMTLFAIAIGVDIAYIVPHHLIRVFLVLAGAPVMARFLRLRLR